MTQSNNISTVKIKRMAHDQWHDADDTLATEEPLEIQLQSGSQAAPQSIAVTMRTPGNDLELAIGFLLTEGILKNHQKIETYSLHETANKIVIQLKSDQIPSLQKLERNFYTTSSCGVCGKSSIESIKTISQFSIHKNSTTVNAQTLLRLEKELLKQQAVFSQTGGLHASALFDQHGDFLLLREDVGRHNALDKIIGAAFLEDKLPLSNVILLLSGRASFELIQKASMAGIAIVAAVGAPSSLAVSLATEVGITLIGFLRNQRFNIYSGAERIYVNKSATIAH